ncbi:Esterase [Grifola frondosa]|uniref:Esterase n=1 Tax=Grifola frondosa TaxID=5627 RepID=A0A1C7LUF6_GRIFR|nr:Esterase [Grifola frondosa]
MVYDPLRQPLKTIYLFYELVATVFVRIPFWVVIYTPRAFRPRRSWTLKKCLTVNIWRVVSPFGDIADRVGSIAPFPTHKAIPDTPGIKSVWLDPAPELVVDPVKSWADAAGVRPARIPGYWHGSEGADTPPRAHGKVIYYLHGGGFISLSAHPREVLAAIPRALLSCCPSPARAFAVEYRLTAGPPRPAHPFPASLLDALAGYRYLVSVVGFAPADIVLVGDSAGGNLALAFARYLVENRGDVLPAPPGALILLSPWTDLGTSHEIPGSSLVTALSTDMLADVRTGVFRRARKAYVGPLGFDGADANRYLSPGSRHERMEKVSFVGFPRTFIVAGDAEIFLDQIRTLRDKMVGDMGEHAVAYFEAADAVHDFIAVTPDDPQIPHLLRKLKAWLA